MPEANKHTETTAEETTIETKQDQSTSNETKSAFEATKGGIIVSTNPFPILDSALQVQFQPVSVLTSSLEAIPVNSGLPEQALNSEIYHSSVTLTQVHSSTSRALIMANSNISSTPRGRKRTATSRLPAKLKEPAAVARRNARERRRVKMVNDGFLRLRKHVPTDPKNKKLSKVKTLRLAIDYIKHLQQLLVESSVKQSHSAPSYTNLAGIPEDLDPNPSSWLHPEHLVSNFTDFSANFSLV